MTMIQKSLLIVLAQLFVSITFAGTQLVRTGPPPNLNIARAPQGTKQTALIVIDMQEYFTNRQGYDKDPKNKEIIREIIAKQILMINQAKQAGRPIVMVEYDCNVCGETVDALKKAVAGYNNVKFIKKNTDGLFDPENKYLKDIMRFLDEKNVADLIITGANGGACVEETITTAFAKGFNITAVREAIADFNYRDFIYPYSYPKNYKDYLKSVCANCQMNEVTSSEELKLPLRTVPSQNEKIGLPPATKPTYDRFDVKSAQ